MNRTMRLCVTAVFAAALGLGMLPTTASGSASGSADWDWYHVYGSKTECTNTGSDEKRAGTFAAYACTRVEYEDAQAYVLWVIWP